MVETQQNRECELSRTSPAPAGGVFSCVAAEEHAFEGKLLDHLRHRLDDADTANDALQDVFEKAMRHA